MTVPHSRRSATSVGGGSHSRCEPGVPDSALTMGALDIPTLGTDCGPTGSRTTSGHETRLKTQPRGEGVLTRSTEPSCQRQILDTEKSSDAPTVALPPGPVIKLGGVPLWKLAANHITPAAK